MDDIDEKVAVDNRQDGLEVDASHLIGLMAVLEGRTTWSRIVRDARKLASGHTSKPLTRRTSNKETSAHEPMHLLPEVGAGGGVRRP